MLEARPSIWETLHGFWDAVRWLFTVPDFALELRLDAIDCPEVLRALEDLHGGSLSPEQLWHFCDRAFPRLSS